MHMYSAHHLFIQTTLHLAHAVQVLLVLAHPLTQDLLCFTGLNYYNDLVQPVPREEAIKIKDIVVEEVWLNEGNCSVFNHM